MSEHGGSTTSEEDDLRARIEGGFPCLRHSYSQLTAFTENLLVLFPDKNINIWTANGTKTYCAVVRTQNPDSLVWDPVAPMATVMDTEGYPPYETVLQVLEKLWEVTRKEVDKLLDACKNKHKVTAQSGQTFGGKPSTGAFGTNTSTHQGNPFENAKSVVNRGSCLNNPGVQSPGSASTSKPGKRQHSAAFKE
ncbi:hypothetical protein PLIIFM63780_008787 [Purpureocillium lilacinum]|uniref:uncharacterized protein n=1 Tax=Purpureocillium lilacinum TaxID=33203 RepID=UPI002081EDE7|nr:hypothetical protein PLICBS_009139 [Purpureocillium lilacinum]GJN85223.1 hypothetical protein PLIIFM63780_008787 [Purpureocillium lilacinum]